MGAQLEGLAIPQHLLSGNPYATQSGMARRRGNAAAQYHGAGSGHAAQAGFNRDTLLERDAIRRQQLQMLAQAMGGQIQQAAYYGSPYMQNGFNTPQVPPQNPAMQAQGQMGAPPPQLPRTVFINGQAVPTPSPWQHTQQLPPEK